MSCSRLPIALILVAAYTVGYAAWGNVPRVLCQGVDGHTCVEMPGNRCCQTDPTDEQPHDHPDQDDCGSPVAVDSSCGQCTDSEVPADGEHQASSHKGQEKPVTAVCAPVCVVSPPADLVRVVDTRPLFLPLSSTAGGFIVLRC